MIWKDIDSQGAWTARDRATLKSVIKSYKIYRKEKGIISIVDNESGMRLDDMLMWKPEPAFGVFEELEVAQSAAKVHAKVNTNYEFIVMESVEHLTYVS